jgi:LytS/YehU family sensor histidine kinase
LVPGFLLQPLIENAIKYALAPSADPVTIRVEAARNGEQLAICVEDDGAGQQGDAKAGTGLGIANVRRRLQTLYGEHGSLETLKRDRGYIAISRLPLELQDEQAAA